MTVVSWDLSLQYPHLLFHSLFFMWLWTESYIRRMSMMYLLKSILPTLIGLMMAVGILRASGFLAWISAKIGILTDPFGIPSQMIPLIIVRMFSSSAATGLSLDLFREYGTDSYIGLITSIMMSCTETIFYTMSVYFLAAKVRKTRWTLAGALVSTAAGIAASVFLARLMS